MKVTLFFYDFKDVYENSKFCYETVLNKMKQTLKSSQESKTE